MTEAKSSSTAGFTPNQKTGYPSIEQNGGTVVGNNGAAFGYPAGTVIPPTQVDVIRLGSSIWWLYNSYRWNVIN